MRNEIPTGLIADWSGIEERGRIGSFRERTRLGVCERRRLLEVERRVEKVGGERR